MKIDNFALQTFQACPKKFDFRMVQGWTVRRKSAALGFGGALHEGLATWYRTGELKQSLTAIAEHWPENSPVDDYRNIGKCLEVMRDYTHEYPKESFSIIGFPDSPMIEMTFTLDTEMFLNCPACRTPPKIQIVDGPPFAISSSTCDVCQSPLERIEYGGIFDGMIEFSGSVYVFEHKSTSQLGAYYFNQFKPNNQVTGYVWAGSMMSGERTGGALINAIGVYKASKTKFERRLTNRSKHEISEWLVNLRSSCQQIDDAKRYNEWPRFTHNCTMYGMCEYHSVCVLGNEKERLARLETDYVRDKWEYEKRSDTA